MVSNKEDYARREENEAGLATSPAVRIFDVKEVRENVLKGREHDAQTLKDAVMKFSMESQEKIRRNGTIIAEFRKMSPDAQNELTAKHHTKVDDLEKKNNDMKVKLDSYQIEGKGRWISFKHELNHDLMEVEKALKDITIER